jgi:subfamily B ATP-binding cassette protein MsbA
VFRRHRNPTPHKTYAHVKHDLTRLRRLYSFTRPYRWRLLTGIVAVAIAGSLGLLFPLIVRDLFNTAFQVGNRTPGTEDLNGIAVIMAGLFLTQGLFNYLRVYNLSLVGEGVVADLRKTLYNHLLDLSLRFFEDRRTGEITSRLTSDITTVQGAVSQALAQFINQLITLIGGVFFLFFLNFRLTFVMLSIIPAVIIAAAYFGRRLRKISTRFQDQVADANASAEEALVGIRVVKSFTAERVEKQRYGALIDDSYRLAKRRAMVRALFIPSTIMAMFVGIGVVLWVGGRLVLTGQLPPGDLIAFLLLTIFVAGSIGTFTGLYSQLQEALGASKRIFELLDTVTDLPEPDVPATLPKGQGQITFEGVSFKYGDRSDEEVLKGIDLEVQPGEMIALVGPSGAGKSTLVALVPRFFDPEAGRILLDKVDLRRLRLHDLRATIGIVPQETHLFSGSVAENILYGRPKASQAELIEAAVAANADEFIRDFPDGYDTLVGERGVKLSGGQRQRIAIARAILKDPKILILDEATSSLDSESENLVQAALEMLMKDRTTFVIAHRLSTILTAHRILVLDRGRIVEQGTHQALLNAGGLYRDLYEKQYDREVLRG